MRPGIRSRQLADDAGLEVVNVTTDSTADKSGIQPGDEVQVLVERDGEEKIVFLKMLAPQ